MKIMYAVATIATTVGVVLAPGQAVAASPERATYVEQRGGVVGSCGTGDELVGDLTVTSTITTYSSGKQSLKLELVGTITRSGTGVVGYYSERQRDFFLADGSQRFVGLLGHLVVPGGGGFTLAGQIRVDIDGTLSSTPGLADLFDLDFDAVVCQALDR